MWQKISKLALSLLFLTLVLSACTWPWQNKPGTTGIAPTSSETVISSTATSLAPENSGRLKKFRNYEELGEFLNSHNNPETFSTNNAFFEVVRSSQSALLATGKSMSTPQAAVINESVPNNFLDRSSTNNQVAGVDEADIIKTDGRYIYALSGRELVIIKAEPVSEAAVLSRINFTSRPQDILIKGNFLTVFGQDEQIYSQALYSSFKRQNPYVFLKVFDISDPVNPKQVRDLDFEGSYQDARLIGDYVYFLTNTYANYLANEPLLPRLIENGRALPYQCVGDAKCFTPEVYYFDIPYQSYSFTNIYSINIQDSSEEVGGQAYLAESGQNLYVSQNNLYITYTQSLSEDDLERLVKREVVFIKLSQAEQEKIKQIEATPEFILNNYEKISKVQQLLDRYLSSLGADVQTEIQKTIDEALKLELEAKTKEMEKTIIHKFSLKNNQIEYSAMGSVNGQVLNQFSMDEDGDYFRIATTRRQQWSRFSGVATESYSNLYVLDAKLQPVGKLENLATTETIYSVRFIGERAYLTTFKQVDPLFAISLKDPTKPEVLNALKIPGFSNYLHPVDRNGNQLIGLGRDAQELENGGVKIKGLKLSLFDFTDTSKPKELDSYLIGDELSDSIALSDHRAFLYSAEKNIIVIPAVLREKDGRSSFGGVLVFSIENNRLNLKAQIEHASSQFSTPDYWRGLVYYDDTVKRSLYINDSLITFSDRLLKFNSLNDWQELKSLTVNSNSDYTVEPANPGTGESGATPAAPEADLIPAEPSVLPPPAPEAGIDPLLAPTSGEAATTSTSSIPVE